MDRWRLSTIATNAIQHTLRYHLGPEAELEERDKTFVRNSVRELFPLREHAQDIHVAHLEIACDAAVSFAEAFNQRFPKSQRINLRWFYICVQGLLSIELKPELLQDGQVDRLQLQNEQLDSASEDDSSSSEFSSTSSTGEDAPLHDTSVERSATADDEPPVAMKDNRTKWEEDELKLMVELKKSGLTHKLVAERLGRTQSAVENKYGRMMKK